MNSGIPLMATQVMMLSGKATPGFSKPNKEKEVHISRVPALLLSTASSFFGDEHKDNA